MRKKTKIWLFVATSLILVGGIIFGGVMIAVKGDLTKLSTAKWETNRYEISEDFTAISVYTNMADITFAFSENAKPSVVCDEYQNMKHTVSVKEGALVIEMVDTRKWYEYIGITFRKPQITVYMPQAQYGALCIKSSTGDVGIPKEFCFDSVDISVSTGNVKIDASSAGDMKINTTTGHIGIKNLSAGALDLSVSTGRVTVADVSCEGDVNIKVSTGKTDLTNVTCKNVISDGSTGKISLNNVVAAEKFSIKRSTGDVRFDGSDAAEIFVETDTGDVMGTLLSEKIFITQTDTGKIDVPKTTVGGPCEIITDTGNIQITIP